MPQLACMKTASFICRIILLSVACLALPYFSTLFRKPHDLRKKVCWTYNVFWFSPQLLFETFLILRRTQRDVINVDRRRSSSKYSLFLLDFNQTWIFPTDFEKKNLQIRNFRKIRPVGAELFHENRHIEVNSQFSRFCERD